MQGSEDSEGAPLAGLKLKLTSRNLSNLDADTRASTDEIDEALRKLSQARLDREGITVLEPSLFSYLPQLSSLYLQQNELKSLWGIQEAKELQFLTVAGNTLTAIEGLKGLQKLRFLDVSSNSIDRISVELDLPLGLSFLNVCENPCCEKQDGLMQSLVEGLPNLKELDGLRVSTGKASSGLQPVLNEDTEPEHGFFGADEAFLEELQRTTYDDPLLNEEPEEALTTGSNDPEKELKELLKVHTNIALPADAVQSIFESKSQRLRTSFEEILQRSRARLQQEDYEEKQSAPAQMYQQGEVRARLQDFLSASALAKELKYLDEQTVSRNC